MPRAREGAVQAVLGALQRTRPDAWLAYCQRLIDLEVVFVAPGTLRTGRKLLRLVDERLQRAAGVGARAGAGDASADRERLATCWISVREYRQKSDHSVRRTFA